MNGKFFIFPVLMALFVLPGCLKTRSDVKEHEERQVVQTQVSSMQKTQADSVSKVIEVDEDLRDLRGRVEVLENRLGQKESEIENSKKSYGELSSESNRKVIVLQEEVGKLSAAVAGLQAEIAALRAEKTVTETTKSVQKGSWDMARAQFSEKEWKKAILSLQKYRDESPKGKHFPEATYLMGVSFQELGMGDEAKTFYDELIEKFPNSQEAKKAKQRLKSIKK